MQYDTRVKCRVLASVFKGNMNANMMESCVATIRSMIDHYKVTSPNYHNRGMEVVASFTRDATRKGVNTPIPYIAWR